MSVRMLKFKVTPYGTFSSGQVVAGLPPHLEYQLMESGDAVSAEIEDFAGAVVGAAFADFMVTRNVAIGVLGQSVERGSGQRYIPSLGPATSPSSYIPVYARSLDGQQDPIPPSTRATMSMWPLLAQKLAQRGVQAKFVNGAVGSLSFIGQTCGQIKSWSANREFFAARAPGPVGDRGDKGDLIGVSGRLWRCTTGNGRYAFFDDPSGAGLTLYSPGGNTGVLVKQLDYIQYDRSSASLLKTGATIPAALSSAGTEGVTTVTDGGIVWTLVSNAMSTDYSSFLPFPRTLVDFDPLGVLARLKASLDAVPSVTERWLIVSNGQSDVQGSVGSQPTIQGWYKAALENIADWAVAQGYRVLLGFTCANPNDEAQNAGYRWVTLDAAWAEAVASRSNGTTVFPGANLYRSLGLSPSVYPQAGLVAGVHLTDVGLVAGAEAWRDAMVAAGF